MDQSKKPKLSGSARRQLKRKGDLEEAGRDIKQKKLTFLPSKENETTTERAQGTSTDIPSFKETLANPSSPPENVKSSR